MTLLDSVNTVVGLCGIRLKKVSKSFKAVWTYPKYAGNVGLINHGSFALKKETTPYRHNLYSFSASLVPGILPNIDFHQDPLQNGTCYTSCHCLTLNNLKNSTTLIFFFFRNNQQEQVSACSCWWKGEQNLTNAVTRGRVGTIPKKKNFIIIITATDFPAIWPVKKEHKNAILITRPSPDLGCVASSLWNFCVRLVPRRSDFAGKPMMALRNFDCSLRLAYSEEEAKA